MSKIPRTYRKYRKLTEHEWTAAIGYFERGDYHANKIADMFGVCEKTMRAGLRARGATKACQVDTEQAELVAAVKEQYRLKAELQRAIDAAIAARTVQMMDMMGCMVAALEAQFDGDPLDWDVIDELVNSDPLEGLDQGMQPA